MKTAMTCWCKQSADSDKSEQVALIILNHNLSNYFNAKNLYYSPIFRELLL
jgi:hypothetical protein